MATNKNSKVETSGRYQFLLRNVFKGLLVLAVFILVFILFRKFAGANYIEWFNQLSPALVFTVYTFSEILFGIITPEIFMAWGIEQGDWKTYVRILTGLTLISYAAGYMNYWVGRLFRSVTIVRWFLMKRMKKYSAYLNRFGGFLIIVASTTPLPFAAICLLVGSTNYSHKKFVMYSLFRLARYAIYGFLVWKAGSV
ncbi:MAG: VTT domain-containing protein [Bacteroidia bacterium]